MKTYQKTARDTPDGADLAVPEQVSVVMAEIAGNMQEGLLALAVGAGLQVMSALMDADVTGLAGPKGRHDAARTAVRHGTGPGSVTLGGRRVGVERPRVRAADGPGELPVPAYELFSSTELLGRLAMEKILAGLSTRRYPVGLEPIGAKVAGQAASTSKSAVSRRFVAATRRRWLSCWPRTCPGWTWWRSWSTGCISPSRAASSRSPITLDGTKVLSSLVEGSTENATLVPPS